MDTLLTTANDKIHRHAEKGCPDGGFSPMDPPDAYAPPGTVEPMSEKDMHPVLRGLMNMHREFSGKLDLFEKTLIAIQNEGLTRERDAALKNFFRYFDDLFVAHHQIEEKLLFPLLNERLIESGEHSRSDEKMTAVDMLEDDHIKSMQLMAIVFNFLGLATRLPDMNSRLIVLDSALEQGKALVELMRLHIFREDTIVFPLAQRLMRKEELDKLAP